MRYMQQKKCKQLQFLYITIHWEAAADSLSYRAANYRKSRVYTFLMQYVIFREAPYKRTPNVVGQIAGMMTS